MVNLIKASSATLVSAVLSSLLTLKKPLFKLNPKFRGDVALAVSSASLNGFPKGGDQEESVVKIPARICSDCLAAILPSICLIGRLVRFKSLTDFAFSAAYCMFRLFNF